MDVRASGRVDAQKGPIESAMKVTLGFCSCVWNACIGLVGGAEHTGEVQQDFQLGGSPPRGDWARNGLCQLNTTRLKSVSGVVQKNLSNSHASRCPSLTPGISCTISNGTRSTIASAISAVSRWRVSPLHVEVCQVLCAHGAELVVVEAAELSVGQTCGEGMIKSEHCQ